MYRLTRICIPFKWIMIHINEVIPVIPYNSSYTKLYHIIAVIPYKIYYTPYFISYTMVMKFEIRLHSPVYSTPGTLVGSPQVENVENLTTLQSFLDPKITRNYNWDTYNVRPPKISISWLTKAPVTSSLFAYHKPVRDIGVICTNLAILGASHCMICREYIG